MMNILLIQVGLLVTSLGGIALHSWWQWRKQAPTSEIHGIGVRYRPDTIEPWPGLGEAIESIVQVVMTDPKLKDHTDKLRDFQIEVWPHNKPIIGGGHPTGFIGADGYPAPAPKTVAEAEDVLKVTGARRVVQVIPGIKSKYVIMVLQQRYLDAGETMGVLRMGQGSGRFRNAGQSSLFHEVAQHLVPSVVDGTDNANHSDAWAKQLERTIANRFASKY